MPKVLFSHSYFLRFDPKQLEQMQPYPPLGTLYAASVLRESAYEIALFDPMFAHSPAELIPHLEANAPRYFVICDDGFNYLTKMCLTNMRQAAFEMIRMAHDRGCVVIVNSSDSSDHYEKYLDQGADYVINGEVEISLRELLSRLEGGDRNLESVEGLI